MARVFGRASPIVMPTHSSKLFHVLVVLGASAVGSAAGCKPDHKPVEPDAGSRAASPTERGPSIETPDRVASQGTPEPASACEPVCAGEGVGCTSNGVLCCWGTDPCCESCCG